MSQDSYIQYRKKDITDRQINELVGLAKGFLADDHLADEEILFLHQWMANSRHLTNNQLIRGLYQRVVDALEDGIIDETERRDLKETLQQFAGEQVEFGEIPKTTTLPVSRPEPSVLFEGRIFCMTGTFAYGTRSECETVVKTLGGVCKSSPTLKTDYMVIGTYVTDSWKYSNHGRKIEKACEIRDDKGKPLAIVTEEHWQSFLPQT